MSSIAHQVLAGLDSFWPSLKEVKAIGTEAEALPDPVLLAVHRHMDMVRRPFVGADAGVRVQEEALLDFVLNGLKPEGYLLAPVTGPSGAGKSHLVRWLEIRLSNHPEAARFNLIRVPKSASLRTVVEAVLQPVAHLPQYAEIIESLRQASTALNPDEAATLFGAMMQLGLKEKAAQWRQQRESIGDVPSGTLAVHATQLASYIQDPVIAPHLLATVYPRLLTRALRGRVEDAADADRPPQFEIGDLKLPASLLERMNEAARSTQTYFLSRLERADGRAAALVALNAVVDNAIARVFSLGQLPQNKTLQDIMREIREQLYETGRELVLLVEDFYALTGIQDQLLSLCIQGVNDGPRPMCPMRTVMAMTDSTLDGRDTIKTRSEYQWALVTEEIDEEEIVEALVDLAGRYLNAARIGRPRLVQSYDAASGTVLHQFTPELDDPKGSDLRKAFGETAGGIPLFPLSREAIRFLAHKHLVSGGRLFFNPRVALQRIVRDVLLARPSFERGTFPAGLGIQDPLAIELTRVLTNVPEDLKARYQSTIVCWGNDPKTTADLHRVPAEVFEAFGLPALPDSPKAPASGPIVQPRDPTSTPQSSTVDKAAQINVRWRERIDAWARGQRLDMQDAQEIRRIIRDHVLAHIDWNATSLNVREFDALTFELPNALGRDRKHKAECPVVEVIGPAGNAAGATSELGRELLALLRYQHVKSWDYADGEEDSLYVCAFLDRMSKRLEQAALVAAESKLVPLAHGALWSGAIRVGLPEEAALADRIRTALKIADDAPIPSGSRPWDDLRQECWSQRDAIRSLLLRYLRVAQGDTETPYGVDAARFARAIAPVPLDAGQITQRLHDDADVQPAIRSTLGKLTAARLKPPVADALKQVHVWIKAVLTDSGLEGDPEEPRILSEASIQLMDDAWKAGLWPAPTLNGSELPDQATMIEAARQFSTLPWENMVAQCRALAALDGTQLAEVVPMLANMKWNNLQFSVKFVVDYIALLNGLERRVSADEAVIGSGSATGAVKAMRIQFDVLDSTVRALSGGKS